MLIALQWPSLEVTFTERGEGGGGDRKFKTVIHLFTKNSMEINMLQLVLKFS